MAVNIYINGIRVAKASSYRVSESSDIQEEETFDGIDLSKNEATRFTISLTRVDTNSAYETTLERAQQGTGGFPMVIQDENVLVKCSGCLRAGKNINREPRSKRKMDLEFRAVSVVEEYR